jgi:hypothetical protein
MQKVLRADTKNPKTHEHARVIEQHLHPEQACLLSHRR